MGSCSSNQQPLKKDPASNISKLIDVELEKSRKKEQDVTKLLLLGTGNSGKSTVLKQFQLMHCNGFQDDERLEFKGVIWKCVVTSMKILVNGVNDLLHSTDENSKSGNPNDCNSDEPVALADEILPLVQALRNLDDDVPLYKSVTVLLPAKVQGHHGHTESVTMTVGELLSKIWLDPMLQRVYSFESLMPSLEAPIGYLMKNIDRIRQQNYIPIDDDVLHARARTTTVKYLTFSVPLNGRKGNEKKFRLVDVGGQKSERRKWISHFDNVNAIMYVVGLDGYNQRCIEDQRTNRMRESLSLFKEICESPFFRKTNVLLFLNKRDLFATKIQNPKEPLTKCFTSYKGNPNDYDEAITYITKRFVDTHKRQRVINKRNSTNHSMEYFLPSVYTHVTCATDTSDMRFVIKACQSIFLREGIARAGMI